MQARAPTSHWTTPVETKNVTGSSSRNRRETSCHADSVTVLNAQLCSVLEKNRIARLAMHGGGGLSAPGNLYVLHATADRCEYDGRASMVPRRTCAPGRASSCDGEFGHRVSTFSSTTIGADRAGGPESRAAGGGWDAPARSALRRSLKASLHDGIVGCMADTVGGRSDSNED